MTSFTLDDAQTMPGAELMQWAVDRLLLEAARLRAQQASLVELGLAHKPDHDRMLASHTIAAAALAVQSLLEAGAKAKRAGKAPGYDVKNAVDALRSNLIIGLGPSK